MPADIAIEAARLRVQNSPVALRDRDLFFEDPVFNAVSHSMVESPIGWSPFQMPHMKSALFGLNAPALSMTP